MGRYTKGRRYSWERGYRPTQLERGRPDKPLTAGGSIVLALFLGFVATRFSSTFWPGVVVLVLAGSVICLTAFVAIMGWWTGRSGSDRF